MTQDHLKSANRVIELLKAAFALYENLPLDEQKKAQDFIEKATAQEDSNGVQAL